MTIPNGTSISNGVSRCQVRNNLLNPCHLWTTSAKASKTKELALFLLWFRRPLHSISCGRAQRKIPRRRICIRKNFHIGRSGAKSSSKLSSSKLAGQRRCSMTININDIHALIVFCIGCLKTMVFVHTAISRTCPNNIQPRAISKRSALGT